MASMDLDKVKGEPGMYMLGDKKVKLSDWYEGDYYDVVYLFGTGAANIFTGGQYWNIFQDSQGKDLIDWNLGKDGKLPAGQEMTINSIGIHIAGRTSGAATMVLSEFFHFVCERFYFEFKLNRDLVAEGPVMMFQSGYGVSGFSGAGAGLGEVLSNGVPSKATVRPLLVHQDINEKTELWAKITCQAAPWIGATTGGAAYFFSTVAAAIGILARTCLNGFVKKAIGR